MPSAPPFPVALSFMHVGRTMTMNAVARQHWSKTSTIVAEWREAFGWLGAGKKWAGEAVGIDVRPTSRTRGKLGDAAAHAFCAKGAIDGLVDAGVLPDDDPTYVAWTRFYAPLVGTQIPAGHIRLTVELLDLTSTA